jgi:hypothetical protein
LDLPDQEIKSTIEKKIMEIMSAKKVKYKTDKTSATVQVSGAYLALVV